MPAIDTIRCICGFEEDDGSTIACDRCGVWQHMICVNVKLDNVPEIYLCDLCNPRDLDVTSAVTHQLSNRQHESDKGSRELSKNKKKRKMRSAPKLLKDGQIPATRLKKTSQPGVAEPAVGEELGEQCVGSLLPFMNFFSRASEEDPSQPLPQKLEEGSKVEAQYKMYSKLWARTGSMRISNPETAKLAAKLYLDWLGKRDKHPELVYNSETQIGCEDTWDFPNTYPMFIKPSEIPERFSEVSVEPVKVTELGSQRFGLFAISDISPGSMVAVVKGTLVSEKDFPDLLNREPGSSILVSPFLFLHPVGIDSKLLAVDSREFGDRGARFVRFSCNSTNQDASQSDLNKCNAILVTLIVSDNSNTTTSEKEQNILLAIFSTVKIKASQEIVLAQNNGLWLGYPCTCEDMATCAVSRLMNLSEKSPLKQTEQEGDTSIVEVNDSGLETPLKSNKIQCNDSFPPFNTSKNTAECNTQREDLSLSPMSSSTPPSPDDLLMNSIDHRVSEPCMNLSANSQELAPSDQKAQETKQDESGPNYEEKILEYEESYISQQPQSREERLVMEKIRLYKQMEQQREKRKQKALKKSLEVNSAFEKKSSVVSESSEKNIPPILDQSEPQKPEASAEVDVSNLEKSHNELVSNESEWPLSNNLEPSGMDLLSGNTTEAEDSYTPTLEKQSCDTNPHRSDASLLTIPQNKQDVGEVKMQASLKTQDQNISAEVQDNNIVPLQLDFENVKLLSPKQYNNSQDALQKELVPQDEVLENRVAFKGGRKSWILEKFIQRQSLRETLNSGPVLKTLVPKSSTSPTSIKVHKNNAQSSKPKFSSDTSKAPAPNNKKFKPFQGLSQSVPSVHGSWSNDENFLRKHDSELLHTKRMRKNVSEKVREPEPFSNSWNIYNNSLGTTCLLNTQDIGSSSISNEVRVINDKIPLQSYTNSIAEHENIPESRSTDSSLPRVSLKDLKTKRSTTNHSSSRPGYLEYSYEPKEEGYDNTSKRGPYQTNSSYLNLSKSREPRDPSRWIVEDAGESLNNFSVEKSESKVSNSKDHQSPSQSNQDSHLRLKKESLLNTLSFKRSHHDKLQESVHEKVVEKRNKDIKDLEFRNSGHSDQTHRIPKLPPSSPPPLSPPYFSLKPFDNSSRSPMDCGTNIKSGDNFTDEPEPGELIQCKVWKPERSKKSLRARRRARSKQRNNPNSMDIIDSTKKSNSSLSMKSGHLSKSDVLSKSASLSKSDSLSKSGSMLEPGELMGSKKKRNSLLKGHFSSDSTEQVKHRIQSSPHHPYEYHERKKIHNSISRDSHHGSQGLNPLSQFSSTRDDFKQKKPHLKKSEDISPTREKSSGSFPKTHNHRSSEMDSSIEQDSFSYKFQSPSNSRETFYKPVSADNSYAPPYAHDSCPSNSSAQHYYQKESHNLKLESGQQSSHGDTRFFSKDTGCDKYEKNYPFYNDDIPPSRRSDLRGDDKGNDSFNSRTRCRDDNDSRDWRDREKERDRRYRSRDSDIERDKLYRDRDRGREKGYRDKYRDLNRECDYDMERD